jgi:hypothetical protein
MAKEFEVQTTNVFLVITRVAPYRHWMEKASRKQTIFSSKPLGVTAWIFLENNALSLPKTVSMYRRVGLLKNSSHGGNCRLEFFLRLCFEVQTDLF